MIRAAAFIIMCLLLIAAVKASFNAKPPEGAFLIDEAEATAIVCNPVLVPHLAPRSKAVQRV